MERVKGVEPLSSGWKPEALAAIPNSLVICQRLEFITVRRKINRNSKEKPKKVVPVGIEPTKPELYENPALPLSYGTWIKMVPPVGYDPTHPNLKDWCSTC